MKKLFFIALFIFIVVFNLSSQLSSPAVSGKMPKMLHPSHGKLEFGP
jgi:hypothetical protein